MKKFYASALTVVIGALLLTSAFPVNDWRFYLAMTIGLFLQVWQCRNQLTNGGTDDNLP